MGHDLAECRHASTASVSVVLVDGILMFIILWIYARKERPLGAVSAMYAFLYGSARFFTEYFRTPDYEVSFAGMTISAGQMLSLPMIVFGLLALYLIYANARKKNRL